MKYIIILLMLIMSCTMEPTKEVIVIKKVPYEKPVIVFINDCGMSETLFQVAKETLLKANAAEYHNDCIIHDGLKRIDKLALEYSKSKSLNRGK